MARKRRKKQKRFYRVAFWYLNRGRDVKSSCTVEANSPYHAFILARRRSLAGAASFERASVWGMA